MNWLIVLLAVVAIFLLVRRSKPQAPATCGAFDMQFPCHLNGPYFQEPRSSYWEFREPKLNYKYF